MFQDNQSYFFKKSGSSARHCGSYILLPVFEKLRQENHQFEANLCYIWDGSSKQNKQTKFIKQIKTSAPPKKQQIMLEMIESLLIFPYTPPIYSHLPKQN